MEATGNNERPIRVVIGADTFPPDINGAARFAERLAGGLVRRGHDVHIICPAFSEKHGTFQEEHDGAIMTVHRVKSIKLPQHETLRFIWPFTLKPRTDALLDRIKPDVVHIQSHMIVGRYLMKSAKQRDIRVIATNHIMPENLIKYSLIIPKWLEKWAMKMSWLDAGRILRKADAVTTPTRRAAELLEAAADIQGVLAISCGIDASKFANAAPTSNEKPRVLFLGRLDFEKHIHNLLKAVALLPESLGTVVELVGDGGERENLQQLAKELGIADRVIFAGHITDAELPLAYERCTVFAMPSIAELQSIATMEAMATGRPVIAADAMALPHLVHDGDNGYLFPPDDIEVFADRLKRVLTADAAELERLSENSLYLIQSHDIQRTLTIFEDLYRGEDQVAHQSDDNLPSYMAPIGRLTESLHQQMLSIRAAAASLRDRAEERRESFNDRIDDVREEVRERLDDLRGEVVERTKKVNRKVKRTMKRAAKKLKGD